uniref:Uncharacterized protein n=1 Tax=Solanum tuberosum TaxID=4113 RepID=M1DQ19_SOLTU
MKCFRTSTEVWKTLVGYALRQNYAKPMSNSVLISEGKDQVGDEREQSARRRTVLRSSTISPNDSKREYAEGKSRKTMNQTTWWIAECIGDPD